MAVLPYSLEFAYQLLGDVKGKTIVELGFGDASGKTALTSLGASVITVNVSDTSKIPVDDFKAHAVLSNAILSHVDAVSIARQIRRILKPGGIAVFREPVSQPFPLAQVDAVSRAVGRPGRFHLGLLLRLLDLADALDSRLVRMAQRLDCCILERFPRFRELAAPMVWEARKEC